VSQCVSKKVSRFLLHYNLFTGL